MFFDCVVFYNQPRLPRQVIQVVSELTSAVVEMPMYQADRKLFYDTMWWLRYVAHVRNLLAPYHGNYVDATNWIQEQSLFDDLLHLSGKGAGQFSQRLGSQLGPNTAILSTRPAAASVPGSSRL